MLCQTAAFASSDITYIPVDFTGQTGDVAEIFGWGYIGSAQTVRHSFENDGTDSYLALSSDGLKNGSPGGSYYLYNTFYPITGKGEISFKIRFNEGKMKLTAGDQIVSSTLSHEGFSLMFDAVNGVLTCCGETIDGHFETGEWYDVDIFFDCGSHMLSIETCFGTKEISFTDSRIMYITNLTISNADKLPFSFDIKELELINNNSVNSGGGYMSVDENNVMYAEYPESAEYTRSLIENMDTSPRRMEYLDRGMVAVMREDDVYLSWRWLGTEDIETGYNVYRDGVKINDKPIMESTNYIDKNGGLDSVYTVRSVINGEEADESQPTGVSASNELSIPLMQYGYENYSSGDGMIGDLDGDGEYEIVVHRYPEDVFTSENYPLVEAYKLDGTHLWTMDIGPNDLEPKQNPILLYDINDDGKSEVIMRIGDGFTDGEGVSVGDMDGDGKINYRDSVYSGQYLTEGPEYIAVFDGETGGLIDKVPMEGVIARDPLESWGNGSSITHRPWKFMFAPLKIDEGNYTFVICRGIYAKTGIQCWRLNNGKLEMVWDFDSDEYFSYSGQGNHNLASGDVDYDGYDEIIYGGMAVDHDGTPMYTTGLGHGDALHLGDFDVERPGLEVMKTNESETAYANCSMFDARTGEVLWGEFAGKDTTRVLCDDFDPRYEGAEVYTNYKAFDQHGNIIDSEGGDNFAVYWDGDILREINDDVYVTKYMPYEGKTVSLLSADTCVSNNGTKENCTIQADIFGDWREEIVLPSADGKYLKIYTTTCPTPYKLYTLMHDPIYRAAAAWQNNAYNQPPHLGFAWGYETEQIPVPQIYTEHDGVREYSPYSTDKRTYEINTYKGTYYGSAEHKTAIVDGYPRTDISEPSGEEVSEETAAVMDSMAMWFDEILGYKDSLQYIPLPSTAAVISGNVRFVYEGNIEVTDISGTPVEDMKNGIVYDSDTKTLYVPENVNSRIVVSGGFGKQTFTVRGQKYTRKHSYLYDTLDSEPLGSGSDFLDSRMNKNGWKLDGDRENTEVITYADRSHAEKKRLVQIKNHSDADSIFYLDKNDMYINGIATAEFDIQLRSGAKSEFSLSREGNRSLAIRQDNGAIYAADGDEYVLVSDELSTTSGDGAIYRIYADMNFARGIYDIYITEDGNIKEAVRGLRFVSGEADGIDRVSLTCAAGCEVGIDDIDINIYSGIYKIYSEDQREIFFADEPGLDNVTVIAAEKNENGELIYLTLTDSSELPMSETVSCGDVEYFVWYSAENMKPVY